MYGNMVKIKKLYPEAIIPNYSYKGDAGADLYSFEAAELMPGAWHLFATGIAIAMPVGWVGLVQPRSGLAAQNAVTLLNSPGTIDSGYRGQIFVNLINLGSVPVNIAKGDRIAQIVFQRHEQASFLEVDELDSTERGESGHGSTGGLTSGAI